MADLELVDALTDAPPQIEPEIKRDFMSSLEAEPYDDVIGEKCDKVDYVPLLDGDEVNGSGGKHSTEGHHPSVLENGEHITGDVSGSDPYGSGGDEDVLADLLLPPQVQICPAFPGTQLPGTQLPGTQLPGSSDVTFDEGWLTDSYSKSGDTDTPSADASEKTTATFGETPSDESANLPFQVPQSDPISQIWQPTAEEQIALSPHNAPEHEGHQLKLEETPLDAAPSTESRLLPDLGISYVAERDREDLLNPDPYSQDIIFAYIEGSDPTTDSYVYESLHHPAVGEGCRLEASIVLQPKEDFGTEQVTSPQAPSSAEPLISAAKLIQEDNLVSSVQEFPAEIQEEPLASLGSFVSEEVISAFPAASDHKTESSDSSPSDFIQEEASPSFPVSLVQEEEVPASLVASVPEKEDPASPVASVQEEDFLGSPAKSVPEEEAPASPVASVLEEEAPGSPVALAQEEEAPASPVALAQEEEAPASPVALAQEEEAPASPVALAQEEEAPASPVALAQEEEAPASPVALAQEEEAPSSPVALAQEEEAPSSPVALALEEEAPSSPVALALEEEAPSSPVALALEEEAPSSPVALALEEEAPSSPVALALEEEAPSSPVALALEEEAPSSPVALALEEEAPSSPVALALEEEAPSSPVALALEEEAPSSPVALALEEEAPSCPVALAQEEEAPSCPVALAQEEEAPSCPVALAQEEEAPSCPVALAQEEEAPSCPVALAQEEEAPACPVALAQEEEAPASPVAQVQEEEAPASLVEEALSPTSVAFVQDIEVPASPSALTKEVVAPASPAALTPVLDAPALLATFAPEESTLTSLVCQIPAETLTPLVTGGDQTPEEPAKPVEKDDDQQAADQVPIKQNTCKTSDRRLGRAKTALAPVSDTVLEPVPASPNPNPLPAQPGNSESLASRAKALHKKAHDMMESRREATRDAGDPEGIQASMKKKKKKTKQRKSFAPRDLEFGEEDSFTRAGSEALYSSAGQMGHVALLTRQDHLFEQPLGIAKRDTQSAASGTVPAANPTAAKSTLESCAEREGHPTLYPPEKPTPAPQNIDSPSVRHLESPPADQVHKSLFDTLPSLMGESGKPETPMEAIFGIADTDVTKCPYLYPEILLQTSEKKSLKATRKDERKENAWERNEYSTDSFSPGGPETVKWDKPKKKDKRVGNYSRGGHSKDSKHWQKGLESDLQAGRVPSNPDRDEKHSPPVIPPDELLQKAHETGPKSKNLNKNLRSDVADPLDDDYGRGLNCKNVPGDLLVFDKKTTGLDGDVLSHSNTLNKSDASVPLPVGMDEDIPCTPLKLTDTVVGLVLGSIEPKLKPPTPKNESSSTQKDNLDVLDKKSGTDLYGKVPTKEAKPDCKRSFPENKASTVPVKESIQEVRPSTVEGGKMLDTLLCSTEPVLENKPDAVLGSKESIPEGIPVKVLDGKVSTPEAKPGKFKELFPEKKSGTVLASNKLEDKPDIVLGYKASENAPCIVCNTEDPIPENKPVAVLGDERSENECPPENKPDAVLDLKAPSLESKPSAVLDLKAPSLESKPSAVLDLKAPSLESKPSAVLDLKTPSLESKPSAVLDLKTPSLESKPSAVLDLKAPSLESKPSAVLDLKAPSLESKPGAVLNLKAPSVESKPSAVLDLKAPSLESKPSAVLDLTAPSLESKPSTVLDLKAPSLESKPSAVLDLTAPSLESKPSAVLDLTAPSLESKPSTVLDLKAPSLESKPSAGLDLKAPCLDNKPGAGLDLKAPCLDNKPGAGLDLKAPSPENKRSAVLGEQKSTPKSKSENECPPENKPGVVLDIKEPVIENKEGKVLDLKAPSPPENKPGTVLASKEPVPESKEGKVFDLHTPAPEKKPDTVLGCKEKKPATVQCNKEFTPECKLNLVPGNKEPLPGSKPNKTLDDYKPGKAQATIPEDVPHTLLDTKDPIPANRCGAEPVPENLSGTILKPNFSSSAAVSPSEPTVQTRQPPSSPKKAQTEGNSSFERQLKSKRGKAKAKPNDTKSVSDASDRGVEILDFPFQPSDHPQETKLSGSKKADRGSLKRPHSSEKDRSVLIDVGPMSANDHVEDLAKGVLIPSPLVDLSAKEQKAKVPPQRRDLDIDDVIFPPYDQPEKQTPPITVPILQGLSDDILTLTGETPPNKIGLKSDEIGPSNANLLPRLAESSGAGEEHRTLDQNLNEKLVDPLDSSVEKPHSHREGCVLSPEPKCEDPYLLVSCSLMASRNVDYNFNVEGDPFEVGTSTEDPAKIGELFDHVKVSDVQNVSGRSKESCDSTEQQKVGAKSLPAASKVSTGEATKDILKTKTKTSTSAPGLKDRPAEKTSLKSNKTEVLKGYMRPTKAREAVRPPSLSRVAGPATEKLKQPKEAHIRPEKGKSEASAAPEAANTGSDITAPPTKELPASPGKKVKAAAAVTPSKSGVTPKSKPLAAPSPKKPLSSAPAPAKKTSGPSPATTVSNGAPKRPLGSATKSTTPKEAKEAKPKSLSPVKSPDKKPPTSVTAPRPSVKASLAAPKLGTSATATTTGTSAPKPNATPKRPTALKNEVKAAEAKKTTTTKSPTDLSRPKSVPADLTKSNGAAAAPGRPRTTKPAASRPLTAPSASTDAKKLPTTRPAPLSRTSTAPTSKPSSALAASKPTAAPKQPRPATAPDLKNVRSKIGSTDNLKHQPGGGKQAKVEKKPVPASTARKPIPAPAATKTASTKPADPKETAQKQSNGKVQIVNKKVNYSHVQSKCGSKDNIKHVPGGGNVTNAAKPSVGSSRPPASTSHKPGGANVQILNKKVDVSKVSSKCGSKPTTKAKSGEGMTAETGGGDTKSDDSSKKLEMKEEPQESIKENGAEQTTPPQNGDPAAPADDTAVDTRENGVAETLPVDGGNQREIQSFNSLIPETSI
ncbi:uncharacterized protein [Phyllobates terribilis]|uniref:uncharacterized protein isoform X5 n=1 Tax=Phyllobates terribilis TaxID=111132 RepID=UPI003CCB2D6C